MLDIANSKNNALATAIKLYIAYNDVRGGIDEEL